MDTNFYSSPTSHPLCLPFRHHRRHQPPSQHPNRSQQNSPVRSPTYQLDRPSFGSIENPNRELAFHLSSHAEPATVAPERERERRTKTAPANPSRRPAPPGRRPAAPTPFCAPPVLEGVAASRGCARTPRLAGVGSHVRAPARRGREFERRTASGRRVFSISRICIGGGGGCGGNGRVR